MKQQQVVSVDKLAKMLGKSRHYVLDRLRAGLPFVDRCARGIAYTFDPAAARAWCADYDANMDRSRLPNPEMTEGRRRFSMAQAELKELQLAEKRGQLVSIEAVTATLRDELTAVRGRLLAMPGRLAGQLLMKSDPAEIERLIDDEVRAALTELSAG